MRMRLNRSEATNISHKIIYNCHEMSRFKTHVDEELSDLELNRVETHQLFFFECKMYCLQFTQGNRNYSSHFQVQKNFEIEIRG